MGVHQQSEPTNSLLKTRAQISSFSKISSVVFLSSGSNANEPQVTLTSPDSCVQGKLFAQHVLTSFPEFLLPLGATAKDQHGIWRCECEGWPKAAPVGPGATADHLRALVGPSAEG